ncbi:MAG: hydantoinase/oxoprolinase family protein, partial [Dehalococcoidia bacterium]
VTAVGHLPRPVVIEMESSKAPPSPVSERLVTFRRGDAPLQTPVYRREQLQAGLQLEGPAIVEQNDTTTVVWPGFMLAVESHGNMVIQAQGVNS